MVHILTDSDGVIANWGGGWDRRAINYQHLGLPLTADQVRFDLYHGLSPEGKAVVTQIMNEPRFYAELEPIEGAAKALNEMLDEGHEVHIVTSPWIDNETCASDKLAWVERHIGKGWGKRTIITSDKTLVMGDILIDDKPEITGAYAPVWEHVYFTQPYNISGPNRRLSNWTEWRSLLD